MKGLTIHEKAIRLLEGGQVNVDGHRVQLRHTPYNGFSCGICEMDCICRQGSEMSNVCLECDLITNEDYYLELVTNDKKEKQ